MPGDTTDAVALNLFRSLTAALEQAIAARDMDALGGHFALPVAFRTHLVDIRAETREQLLLALTPPLDALLEQGMTRLDLIPVWAGFHGPNVLRGFVEVRAMDGTAPVVAAFQAMLILELYQGAVRITHIDGALKNPEWPVGLPDPAPELPYRDLRYTPDRREH